MDIENTATQRVGRGGAAWLALRRGYIITFAHGWFCFGYRVLVRACAARLCFGLHFATNQ